MHKASFGDKLPNPGNKPANQWTPTEDIVLGTMNFKTLQNSMEKLRQGHHQREQTPTKPVGQGETTSTFTSEQLCDNSVGKITSDATHGFDAMDSNTEVKEAIHNANNLPDLVQRTDNQISGHLEGQGHVIDNIPEQNTLKSLSTIEQTSFGTPRTSRSGSHSSLKSSDLGSALMFSDPGSGSVSHEGSPFHRSSMGSPVNKNVVDIQDPKNFTLGEGGKKRITKASFGKSSMVENLNNPDDPLSSLDPLWSVDKH